MPAQALWKEKAAALRHAATTAGDEVEQQTLLMLAGDCELIADAEAGGQPGKPKPPGNPPNPADADRPAPIEEPPRPIPTPPQEPPPPPMSVRKPTSR
jgi:hypothetical protein